MATKAQLKQRCKELEDMLENAECQRESYAELAKNRQNHIDNLKLVLEKERAWTSNLASTLNKSLDFLKHISREIAVDTIVQRTHRERNAVYRSMVESISRRLDEFRMTATDMDDIPF